MTKLEGLDKTTALYGIRRILKMVLDYLYNDVNQVNHGIMEYIIY